MSRAGCGCGLLAWLAIGAGAAPEPTLPFAPLSYAAGTAATRKLFVHHHNFTVKQDNLDGDDPGEWWNRAMQDRANMVGGQPGDGGLIRSRPYPLPKMDPATYAVDRWKPEFQYYKDANVDVVFLNMQPISGSGGTRQERLLEALDAAGQMGGIKVALNFDFAAGVPDKVPADVAVWVRDNAFSRPAYARAPNGRYYVGAFLAGDDAEEQAWQIAFVNACEAQGTPVAFMPSSNFSRDTTRARYGSLGEDKFPGYGGWGNSRTYTSDATDEADAAWNNGRRIYLWPLRSAQYRIKGGSYVWDESAGPRQVVGQWGRAVAYKTPADPLFAQLLTGTDAFEGTEFWPNTGHNFLWMDLTAWFVHAFKTGAYPAITRDCIMYCHRIQHHTLRGTRDRHNWTYPWNNVAAESNLYAVVFAREPATVEISFAGTTTTQAVPGGELTVVAQPFAAGETGVPRFRLLRNNTAVVDVLSKFPIVASLDFTDPEYKGGSSLRPGTYTAPGPVIQASPASQAVAAGGAATLAVTAGGTGALTYQWRKNGANLPGATAASLVLGNIQPANAGVYSVTVTDANGVTESADAILGVTTTAKVIGTGKVVDTDVPHQNGRIFDQILLTGSAATMTADPGQVLRASYVDLNDDIVQVEFSGSGALTITLDQASGPALPAKYNQNVSYMKGHATVTIAGADATTNLSVFTVGRLTAFDPTGAYDFLAPVSAANDPARNGSPLFPGGTVYDGVADVALVNVLSPTGQLGAIRCANAQFFATAGLTGINAPGIDVVGPVNVHDVMAADSAIPVLLTDAVGATTVPGGGIGITGGSMLQDNGRAVRVGHAWRVAMLAGVSSGNQPQPAQVNQAAYTHDGVPLTAYLVSNP